MPRLGCEIPVIGMERTIGAPIRHPRDRGERPPAGRYAARLYDALREADACGRSRIVIEDVPQDISQTEGLWSAIRDRLRRATGRIEE